MSEREIPEHVVRYVDEDGHEMAVVELRRTYSGDIDDVWEALTDPERLPRWFAPVRGDLRSGGRYQVEGNAAGTILTCDPPNSFTATWEFAGAVSWIAVDLAADGDRTVVRLTHRQRTDNDHWRTFGPSAVGLGWDLSFLGLGLHLDSGAAVDSEAEMAWSVSAEGIAWLTRCGDAWSAADVSGGCDEETARQRAAASIGFFTTAPES